MQARAVDGLGDPLRPGLIILGATLWTDFALDGVENARTARAHARSRWTVSDKAASAPGVPFFPHDAAGAHARSRAFIEDGLNAVAVGAGLYGHMPNPVLRDIGPGDRAAVRERSTTIAFHLLADALRATS